MAGRLQVIMSTIEPGGGTGAEPYTHDSDEEVVVVLRGILDLWVSDEHYVLHEGDAIDLSLAPPALERQPRGRVRHGAVLHDPAKLLSLARTRPDVAERCATAPRRGTIVAASPRTSAPVAARRRRRVGLGP